MTDKNGRHYGDGLEDFVIEYFDQFGLILTKYNNSGAANKNDSDIYDENLQMECKRNGVENRKGESLPKFKNSDWKRIATEARTRNKMPALINSGKNVNEAIVTIRLADFRKLYNAFVEYLNPDQEEKKDG